MLFKFKDLALLYVVNLLSIEELVQQVISETYGHTNSYHVETTALTFNSEFPGLWHFSFMVYLGSLFDVGEVVKIVVNRFALVPKW